MNYEEIELAKPESTTYPKDLTKYNQILPPCKCGNPTSIYKGKECVVLSPVGKVNVCYSCYLRIVCEGHPNPNWFNRLLPFNKPKDLTTRFGVYR